MLDQSGGRRPPRQCRSNPREPENDARYTQVHFAAAPPDLRPHARIRRLSWAVGLNFGRQRGNWFGSFSVTSIAAYGGGALHAITPGPFIVSYGVVEPDQTINVVIRWDHRVTDAAPIARVLTRLEQVLNTEIATELRTARSKPIRAVRA